MKLETAAERRIDHLFHYQPFDLDRLNNLLETRTVFLSNASCFNDPWDCKPYFDFTNLDDPVVYERQVEWFVRVARRQTPNISEARIHVLTEQLRDRVFLEGKIHEMATISGSIAQRYRIYCLTTNPTSTLMWSHYAKNHTGICLGFCCQNRVFCGALRVEYLDTFPMIDVTDDSIETSLLPLLAKSSEWHYEEEYRLIAQEEAETNCEGTLMTQENRMSIPRDALVYVIVGCLMPRCQREDVNRLVREHAEGINLLQAVRVPSRYQLALEQLK